MYRILSVIFLLGTFLFSCNSPVSSTGQSEVDEATTDENDLTQYVDPFIGTGFHGHTFPGPVRPHGMIQLSPDTKLNGWDASSAWGHGAYVDAGDTVTYMGGWGNDADWSNSSLWQESAYTFESNTVYTLTVIWRNSTSLTEALADSITIRLYDTSSSTNWVTVSSVVDVNYADRDWTTTVLVFVGFSSACSEASVSLQGDQCDITRRR